MTANILINTGEGLVVLSDGMAYDAQGIARQFHTKQIVLPSLSAAITCSSSGGALAVLQYLIAQESPSSFDEIAQKMPGWAKEVIECIKRMHPGDQFNYALFVYGGWSDAESGWRSYYLTTYELPPDHNNPDPHLAFVPIETGVYAKPNASKEALEAVGLCDDLASELEQSSPGVFGLKLMLAMRRTRQREIDGPGSRSGYVVGGFVEMTFLRRDSADIRVPIHWPDEIGRPVDPALDPEVTVS